VTASRAVLDELEAVLTQARLEDLPDLLGHLERLRLVAFGRFLALAATPVDLGTDPTALFTIRDTADRLWMSAWNVYDLIRRGELPAVRLGPRKLALRRADVERFVLARRDARDAFTLLPPARRR
jgi:excisionase family DNA binding protein